MSNLKSQCCRADVRLVGMPDFDEDKYPTTVHYECKKCGKSCDIIVQQGATLTQNQLDKVKDAVSILSQIIKQSGYSNSGNNQ